MSTFSSPAKTRVIVYVSTPVKLCLYRHVLQFEPDTEKAQKRSSSSVGAFSL